MAVSCGGDIRGKSRKQTQILDQETDQKRELWGGVAGAFDRG